jgi:hypothetical protein
MRRRCIRIAHYFGGIDPGYLRSTIYTWKIIRLVMR